MVASVGLFEKVMFSSIVQGDAPHVLPKNASHVWRYEYQERHNISLPVGIETAITPMLPCTRYPNGCLTTDGLYFLSLPARDAARTWHKLNACGSHPAVPGTNIEHGIAPYVVNRYAQTYD